MTDRREDKEKKLRLKRKAEIQARREGREPDAQKTSANRGAPSQKKKKKRKNKNANANDFDLREDKQKKAFMDSGSEEDLTVEQKALKRETELNNIENMYKLGQD